MRSQTGDSAAADGAGQGEPTTMHLLQAALEVEALGTESEGHVRAFEDAFARRWGVPCAIAVSSGTAAIHSAVVAIDPEPGDEFITTPITDVGAITPILHQQAVPVFADVDPVSLNITAESAAQRLTPRTRAIIATHLFGNPCDIMGIAKIAGDRGVPVIEDCAQAYLATANGRIVGTVGAIGTFSLGPGMHLATGGGGVIITSDAAAAASMRRFANKGRKRHDLDSDVCGLGLNYRMTELHGAVARSLLASLAIAVRRRRRLANQLTEQLEGTPGLTVPSALPGSTHVYWRYALSVSQHLIHGGRDAVMKELRQRGISCAAEPVPGSGFSLTVLPEGLRCRTRSPVPAPAIDSSEYPGVTTGLAHVLTFPWSDRYTSDYVRFLAMTIQEVVESLL